MSRNDERENLTGKTLGGVKLYRKIGSGGFGDVYIDEAFRIVVKVVWEAPDPESYRREYEAVSRVAQEVRDYYQIQKILGMGDGELLAWGRHGQADSTEILQHPTLVEDSHKTPARGNAYFFYMMTAADNRSRAMGEYEADTLASRKQYGELDENLLPEAEKKLSAEMLDCLLHLFDMGFTHGDLKLSNIFFVNGHISLGDTGCTLYYPGKDADNAYYSSANYTPEKSVFAEWLRMCGGDLLAANMLKDVYMLGRTIRFLKEDVRPAIGENENGLVFYDPPPGLVSDLENFAEEEDSWTATAIRERLHWLRDEYFSSVKQLSPEFFLLPMGISQISSFRDFEAAWTIVKTLSPFSFLVTKTVGDIPRKDCDILLAERIGADYLEKICRRDDFIVRHRAGSMEKIIQTYQLPHSLILLTHAPDCNGKTVQEFSDCNFEGYSVPENNRPHAGKRVETYWKTPWGWNEFDSNFAEICAGITPEDAEEFILNLFKALCRKIIVDNEGLSYGNVCAANLRIEKSEIFFRDIHRFDKYLEPDELNIPPFYEPSPEMQEAMKRKCTCADAELPLQEIPESEKKKRKCNSPENTYRAMLDFYGLARTVRQHFPELPSQISKFCDAMEYFYKYVETTVTAPQVISRLKYVHYRIFLESRAAERKKAHR